MHIETHLYKYLHTDLIKSQNRKLKKVTFPKNQIMKKILWVLCLAAINAGLFAATPDPPSLPNASTTCYSGGRGASSCSIQAGITIGGGISAGCSVTCLPGYYACCGLKCTCVNESEIVKPPVDPIPAI